MKKWILAGVLMGLFAVGAVAQTGAEKALRDSLVKNRFFMRGFSADLVSQWRWDGSSLVEETPQFRTIGVLLVEAVKVKDGKVEIQGQRHTLLRSKTKGYTLSGAGEEARIEVDLSKGNVPELLPKLSGLIFYPDMQHAVADIPAEYRELLPSNSEGDWKTEEDKAKLKLCDCAHPDAATCGRTVPDIGMTGMEKPTVSFQVPVENSDQANRRTFEGNIQVDLIVGTTGKPEDLWLAYPGGMGMDAKALEAVSKYRFKPATCHGQAVPVTEFVPVSFKSE